MTIRTFILNAADGSQPSYSQIYICDYESDRTNLLNPNNYVINKGDRCFVNVSQVWYTSNDALTFTADPSPGNVNGLVLDLLNDTAKNFRLLLLHYAETFGTVPPGLEDQLSAAQQER